MRRGETVEEGYDESGGWVKVSFSRMRGMDGTYVDGFVVPGIP